MGQRAYGMGSRLVRWAGGRVGLGGWDCVSGSIDKKNNNIFFFCLTLFVRLNMQHDTQQRVPFLLGEVPKRTSGLPQKAAAVSPLAICYSYIRTLTKRFGLGAGRQTNERAMVGALRCSKLA